MKLKSLLSIISIILFLSSCSSSRDNNFTKISPDLSYKLHSIGETGEKIKRGDYITVHFQYSILNDSVFYEDFGKFRVSGETDLGSIIPALLQMSKGDSASLIINTSNFFKNTLHSELPDFLDSHLDFLINIKINEVQNSADFEKEKNLFMEWLEEYYASESQLIEKYLNRKNIFISASESGLYFQSLKVGNNKKVMTGKRVWIQYSGRFMNGRFIDNSTIQNNPVDFIYGTQMVLIEGLEEALGRMHEHEKALVIIPSKLAFGKYGTADNSVPPFTTLIYELEVLKVE